MTYEQIKLEKAFHGDYCEWEQTLTALISPELRRSVDRMQTLIREHSVLRSVKIDVPYDFIAEETETLLQEQCRYDVSYISVYSHGFVFCIQGKWDAHIQAEYTIA
ncbi:MAG: hypothetical protein AAFV88_12515 [Planctomycetota bacterium]